MTDLIMPVPTVYKKSFWGDIFQSLIIAVFLTVLSFFVGIEFGWIESISWLEAFAVATSYACTWLCVKQRRINYPIGIISTIAYVALFFQADLLASMAVNIYLIPTLIYGWVRWNRDEDTRPVKNLEWKMVPVYLLASVGFFTGATLLVNALGGTMAGWDSLILVGTILAQFLLDNKKLQTWIVWAAVNVVAIYVYMKAGLTLAAFQYVFFLLNSFLGYKIWKGTIRQPEDPRISYP